MPKQEQRTRRHKRLRQHPLVFIDTSYYLRYYGELGNEEQLAVLNSIDKNRTRIISTEQVLMEFAKNRETILARLADQLKDIAKNTVQPQPLFRPRRKKLFDLLEDLNKELQEERDWIELILRSPTEIDPIYQHLLGVVRASSEWTLTAAHPQYSEIREAAYRRYQLGYPPRKDADTSCGDALNWEWIVTCARRAFRDVTIVTRDSDFGVTRKGVPRVNDWLALEFAERTTRRIKVVASLEEAFSGGPNPLTRKQAKAEKQSIAATPLGTLDSLYHVDLLDPVAVMERDVMRHVFETAKSILASAQPPLPTSPSPTLPVRPSGQGKDPTNK